jgi:hypothetical protein
MSNVEKGTECSTNKMILKGMLSSDEGTHRGAAAVLGERF